MLQIGYMLLVKLAYKPANFFMKFQFQELYSGVNLTK